MYPPDTFRTRIYPPDPYQVKCTQMCSNNTDQYSKGYECPHDLSRPEITNPSDKPTST